jgi:hypothetical protein
MSGCQAIIPQGPNKGKLCSKKANGTYCDKHIRYEFMEKAKKENIRYCDIARGCFTILENHQVKCTHCLHKARIRDRKRDGEKRSNPNQCLDCGREMTPDIRAIGKHNKLLRRCIPCYTKLQKQETTRKERIRNYKKEYFLNKYVAWNHYVKGAKRRGLDFTLTKTQFESLLIQPCFYCNHFIKDEINGIDRINNHKGYIAENVVTCCKICNITKGSQHPQEWLDKMYAIHQFHTINEPILSSVVDKWYTTYLSRYVPTYQHYKKNAITRNIEYTITEDDFKTIISQECYLCGLKTSDNNINGIDRKNNTLGYHLLNCKPCCGHCNLLKKDIFYEVILELSMNISMKYHECSIYIQTLQIVPRSSKIEARPIQEDYKIEAPEPRIYKPINEIIVSQSEESIIISKSLKKEPVIIISKQWKTKQIYNAIRSNQENDYKAYCKDHNDIKDSEWNTMWTTFVQVVKGKTEKDAEKIIRDFVENLRRLRHNQLCKKDVIERENRQQWPNQTIIKAFLEGKIEKFKSWTEQYAGDNPEDPVWMKRWVQFIQLLDKNRENEKELKKLCSSFLTAQRTKKYRRLKNMNHNN